MLKTIQTLRFGTLAIVSLAGTWAHSVQSSPFFFFSTTYPVNLLPPSLDGFFQDNVAESLVISSMVGCDGAPAATKKSLNVNIKLWFSQRTYKHSLKGTKVCLFVCLCWGLTSQSTIFQSCRDGATASWVINQYFWGVKCLAQGHNTAEVGIEPLTSRSGVRHSTTEPPRSPPKFVYCGHMQLWSKVTEYTVANFSHYPIYCIYSNKCPLSNKHPLHFLWGKSCQMPQTLKFSYFCPYFVLRMLFFGLLNCRASRTFIRINTVFTN